MNILKYYEDGGAAYLPARVRDRFKANYKDWVAKLKDEYYTKGNRVGRQKLFGKIKQLFPGIYAHPSARFVGAWLKNQHTNQIFRKMRKAKTIQATITNRPNDLLQVDYAYFLPSKKYAVKEDKKHKDTTDEEWETATKELAEEERHWEKEKFDLKSKKNGIHYRGAITAIDVFSRRGYARAVPGNINSEKAFNVVYEDENSIVKCAEEWVRSKPYLGKSEINRIQTDKGSEFMLYFRDGLRDATSANNMKLYKHSFGFQGRSQTQGVVERFNGTLKRIVKQLITNEAGEVELPRWHLYLATAVDIYNHNIHSTIMRAPNTVGDEPDDVKTVKQAVLNYAKKHHRYAGEVYKEGDYVRIYNYNHKKRGPMFSLKGGPLLKMVPHETMFIDEIGERVKEFAGIYMIHSVNPPPVSKIGKTTTYTIISQWIHEKLIQPSAIQSDMEDRRVMKPRTYTVDTPDTIFEGYAYPKGSYKRKFMKEELVGVERGKDGYPIVDKPDEPMVPPKFVEPIRESKKKERPKRAKKAPSRLGFDGEEGQTIEQYKIKKILEKKKNSYLVLWEYGDESWETRSDLERDLGEKGLVKILKKSKIK